MMKMSDKYGAEVRPFYNNNNTNTNNNNNNKEKEICHEM